MIDREALSQQGREVEAGAVAVGVGRHQHVRRERREAGGHLPDVEVVDLDDPRPRGERVADRLDVEALRRRLEEDPP